MSATQTSRRVSMTQLHHLWEFLSNHREIAVGYNKSTQARDHSRRMWERAAEILNSTGDGATKSASEWSKYWVDFKAKLKRKNRLIIESHTRTGGGPATNLELTEIERKFISILGEDYGSGLPGVRVEPLLSQDFQEDIAVPSNADTSQSTATEDSIYIVVASSEDLQQSGPNEATTSTALQQRCQTPIRETPVNLPTPVHPPPSPSRQGATGQGARRRLILPVQAEPSPITGQASSEQRRTRRRSRQGLQMSAADARERLVRSSEMRSQAEINNSRSIERAVDYLNEIVSELRNIQSRLTDAVARGASQGPPS